MTEYDGMIPIRLAKCAAVVSVGDKMQLLPVSTDNVKPVTPGGEELLVAHTLYEHFERHGATDFLLHTQYRCPAYLAKIANSLLYNVTIKNGRDVGSCTAALPGLPCVVVVDTHYIPGVCKTTAEIKLVAETAYLLATKADVPAYSICVISMHHDQTQKVFTFVFKGIQFAVNFFLVSYQKQQKIRLALQQFWPSGTDAREIVVGTVDHFQGVEFDIVLLLTGRNLTESKLLDNERSINVALTRTRRHIFLFADYVTIKQSPLWSKIISYPEKPDKKRQYRYDEIKGVMDNVESRIRRATKKRIKKNQQMLSTRSSSPLDSSDFICIREQENAKRQRIEKMGEWPAFEEDMKKLAANYGVMAAEGKAYLASLSDDSDSN